MLQHVTHNLNHNKQAHRTLQNWKERLRLVESVSFHKILKKAKKKKKRRKLVCISKLLKKVIAQKLR